jgi:hypothetical protein
MLEPGQSVAHLVLGIAEAGRATADALAATLGI